MARLPEAADAKPRQAKASLRRLVDGGPAGNPEIASHAAFEEHLSVEDLSKRWGMSQDFVRRLFMDEPGVVVFHNPRPGRRVYRTLRIPTSVAARVYRRLATA